MKKLFLMLMLFAATSLTFTSCEDLTDGLDDTLGDTLDDLDDLGDDLDDLLDGLDDELGEELDSLLDGLGETADSLLSDLTLSGSAGQLKAIYLSEEDDEDAGYYLFSYDDQGRISQYKIIESYTYTEDVLTEYYTSPALLSAASSKGSSPKSRLFGKGASKIAATRSSDSDEPTSSSTTYTCSYILTVSFTYNSGSIDVTWHEVEYENGILEDTDTDNVTYTLNSNGLPSQMTTSSSYTGETYNNGEWTSQEINCVNTGTYTYDASNYITSYNETDVETSEGDSDYYYEYSSKEEYTWSNGNIVDAINYYLNDNNDYESYSDSNSSSELIYGDDLNNLSIDLAYAFSGYEYGDWTMFHHGSFYGEPTKNLPVKDVYKSSWVSGETTYYSNFLGEFEYTYEDGVLTEVKMYYGENWGETEDVDPTTQLDGTLKLLYY